MTPETDRVAVPERIEPASIPEESARQLERVNYAKSRELIAAGERERVERAVRLAAEEPKRVECVRAQWAYWDDMPADLLADLRAGLGRLPHQIAGIERALAD